MDDIRLDSIEDAIADFREGKFVVVVDDEDRENEGDPGACQLHDKQRQGRTVCPAVTNTL